MFSSPEMTMPRGTGNWERVVTQRFDKYKEMLETAKSTEVDGQGKCS